MRYVLHIQPTDNTVLNGRLNGNEVARCENIYLKPFYTQSCLLQLPKWSF